MNFCQNCGAGLGVGRFCTNCGSPVPPSAPVASPPVDPSTPPAPALDREPGRDSGRVEPPPLEERAVEKTQLRMPAVQPEAYPGSRFPLFADEVPTRAPSQQPPDSEIPMWAPPSSDPSSDPDPLIHTSVPADATGAGLASGAGAHRERGRPSRPGWIVAGVVLLLLGTAGVIWLVGGDDAPDAADATGSDQTSQGSQSPGSDQHSAEDDKPSPPEDEGEAPVDLASSAKASGPTPVPPSTDFEGNKFSYPPKHMLDDDPESAYRLDGDASGTSITFDLPEESMIREVGIVNGFAKVGTTADGKSIDWYAKNRRVLEVEWLFDDGTSVTQELRDTTDLQTIPVDKATTETIELRLVEVSQPGGGKWSKDVTSISTVLLRGSSN